MKASPKLFLYLLLGAALILIVIISQSEKKPEESKEFRGMAAKEEGVAIAFEQADKLSIETSITAKKATEVSTGVITTEHGDELLVLVNKNIRLPATYEPEDLVGIDGLVSTTRGGTTLRKEVAKALEKMAKEAKKESIVLTVLSAYRSYWNQQATFSFWVQQVGVESAETFSARPGHSQHQLGTTVDFTSESVNLGLTEDFDSSPEGKWFVNNAPKFGFVLSYPKGAEDITGYTYEPWHYRYIGVENAQKMINSGLILEIFLQKFGVV